MLSYRLDFKQIAELRDVHRRTRDATFADRIKAIVLLGTDWTPVTVAKTLLIAE